MIMLGLKMTGTVPFTAVVSHITCRCRQRNFHLRDDDRLPACKSAKRNKRARLIMTETPSGDTDHSPHSATQTCANKGHNSIVTHSYATQKAVK
jgi:hypothetical protein